MGVCSYSAIIMSSALIILLFLFLFPIQIIQLLREFASNDPVVEDVAPLPLMDISMSRRRPSFLSSLDEFAVEEIGTVEELEVRVV